MTSPGEVAARTPRTAAEGDGSFARDRRPPFDGRPLSHRPLVLLAALTAYVVLRPGSGMLQTTWLLLMVGTIGTVAASVSGLVSHFPYEETDLHGIIERHQ